MEVKFKNMESGIVWVIVLIQIYMMATVFLQAISPLFQIIFWGVILTTFTAYFYPVIRRKRQIEKVEFFYLIYLFYILISAISVNDSTLMLNGGYEYIVFTTSFFSIAYLLKHKLLNKKIMNLAIKNVALITCVVVSLGLFEYRTGRLVAEGVAHVFGDPTLINIRAQVFSGSPLMLGTLIASYSLFFQYLYMKKRESNYLIFSFISLGGVLLTGSRGPLVSLIITSMLQFLLIFPVNQYLTKITKKKKIIILSLALSIALIFVLFLFSYEGKNPVILKIVSIFNWSSDIGNVGRLNTWSNSFTEFQKNWLLGRGISTTGSVTLLHPLNIGVTESSLLKVLVELGVVGFALYFGILGTVFYKGFRVIKDKNVPNRREIILGLALMLLIFIEGTILQITEIFNAAVILWASAGGVHYLTSKEK